MDGLWTVCDLCGSLVANSETHETWHAAGAVESEDPDAGNEQP